MRLLTNERRPKVRSTIDLEQLSIRAAYSARTVRSRVTGQCAPLEQQIGRSRRFGLLSRSIAAALVSMFMLTPAQAACTLLSVSSISGLTASLGTYSATSPPSVTLSLTIVMNKTGNGSCDGTLAFQNSVIPAQMTGPGTPKLTYQVTNTSSASILYTGSPGTRVSLSGVNNGSSTITYNVSVIVAAVAGQTGLPNGNYAGTTVLPKVFDGSSTTPLGGAAPSLSASATVVKTCTIGDVATPAADSATIPINTNGTVNTSVISKSYANGLCNTPSNLQLTSMTGAVLNAASAGSGFTNQINYSAVATFSGASASLNTATNPAASGPESGSASGTSGGTPSGTIAVSITPQSSSSALVGGNYSETLRITITPQ